MLIVSVAQPKIVYSLEVISSSKEEKKNTTTVHIDEQRACVKFGEAKLGRFVRFVLGNKRMETIISPCHEHFLSGMQKSEEATGDLEKTFSTNTMLSSPRALREELWYYSRREIVSDIRVSIMHVEKSLRRNDSKVCRR